MIDTKKVRIGDVLLDGRGNRVIALRRQRNSKYRSAGIIFRDILFGWETFYATGNISEHFTTTEDKYIVFGDKSRPYDNYRHVALFTPNGKLFRIIAGCQRFSTFAQAERHWAKRKRWVSAYERPTKSTSEHNKNLNKVRRERDKMLNKWSLSFVKSVRKHQDKLLASAKAAKAKAKKKSKA